ncbi:septum site-determining protein minD homolog, chloroplastic [Physcomitrium patens]|uniref:CobQ/CobB/MinD/ParA nucleotide binding domain-containing protein n=2 Tax=Physcomitrium patens TaxID=3218 RepID=A0A2K1L1Q3_PHYPA|nr:putative septum site-determining protein minD homolog, chloroplastic [Physcomitrium patens]PNR59941.1 hypothetical protein PHYPA_002733 [Physcomitrium patens]|eukprot:XP_024369027.1 putative septum site-determining protein minD homolog, chloroplastic [Physcomitrella patens]
MRFAVGPASLALQHGCCSNGVEGRFREDVAASGIVGAGFGAGASSARVQISCGSGSRGLVMIGSGREERQLAQNRAGLIGGGGLQGLKGRQLVLRGRESEHGRRCRVVPQALLQWNRRPELVGEIPRVVVITSGKGGVGKTTTTANLGMCLARLNFKVVAIDADVGLRNLDLLLGLENRVNYTAMEVLNGECRLDQALIRDKRWTNFELLCINKPRYKMPLGFGGKALTWLVDALKKRPEGQPHFILIDCPAGIDAGFITAITPAKEAILVTTPDITSLRDADRVTGLLECDGIKDIKMVVNRVRSDMIKGEDMMSVLDVQEMLGLPLLGVVPEDSEVIKSTNRGYPLVLKNPPTLAGLALEQMAWRLVEKDSMKAILIEEAPQKRSLFPFMGGKN